MCNYNRVKDLFGDNELQRGSLKYVCMENL